MGAKILQSGFSSWAQVLLAVGLALVLGAASNRRWVNGIQRGLRRLAKMTWDGLQGMTTHAGTRWMPMLFSLLFSLLAGFVVGNLPLFARGIAGPFAESVARILLLTATLSWGQYLRSGLVLAASLRKEKLDNARKQLHKLTGQDADKMTKQGIARSATGAIAKGLLYELILPLFCWAFGHGFRLFDVTLVLCWAYTALRAMGNREDQSVMGAYGGAAEQILYIVGYLPARLYTCLLLLAALVTGKNANSGYLLVLQQSGPHGNEALPQATLAGSLGLRLGGGAYYHGVWFPAPEIGFDINKPESGSLRMAVLLLTIAVLFYIAVAAFLPRWMSLLAALATLLLLVGRIRPMQRK